MSRIRPVATAVVRPKLISHSNQSPFCHLDMRTGFKLKPSADRPRERPTSTNDRRTADLAEALREALRQREKALQHSSESEDSEDDDEWGD